ncbi:MAG TPA: hypothetical protein VEK84_06535 [Terriglobales bacterium]|nr:hypothetical protein [Terriglobales bacterium]
MMRTLHSEELRHLKGMGRRERRAAETRIKLFRCALQLFAERGFPNVTVEDITADVGDAPSLRSRDGALLKSHPENGLPEEIGTGGSETVCYGE